MKNFSKLFITLASSLIRYSALRYILLLSFLLFFLTSCAKQKVAPPPETKKIPIIRVALDDNFSRGTVLFKSPYTLVSEEASYIFDASIGMLEVIYNGRDIIIKNSERWFEFRALNRLEFTPHGEGSFEWNGVSYQGKLVFQRHNSSLLIINILPLPEYLQGVVPYEIPSHSEEYYQAILSQAVAARTYALFLMKNARNPHYDIYADTRDQVYKGQKFESPLAEKAILESFGLILQNKQNNIEKIQYHSTCGGTVNNGYIADTLFQEPLIIKDLLSGEFNCVASPYYRWISRMTMREILQNLVRLNYLPRDLQHRWEEEGFEMQISVISRAPSGRVKELSIQIDDELLRLSNWQIRQVFSDNSRKPLPSTLFFLKGSPSQESLFYIIGAGYGHGRGMCQWGAIGQSLSGLSYQDILQFYYPGLILNNMY